MKRESEGPARHARLAQVTLDGVVLVLALGCLMGLWRVVAILPLHVPLDPNEGWNAYHAAAAMAGHGLYPGPASFLTNNYPPLSFYIVGALGSAIGDNIIAGRIIALLSFFVVLAGIAAVARRACCTRFEAAFAALFFAAFLLLFSDYVGMDDPQLLGHALQIGGLLLLFRERPRIREEFFAAGLMALGLFVKHNLVVMPAAALVWLGLARWEKAGRFAAFMLFLGLSELVIFRLGFGFDLLSRLASPREYSVALLLANFGDWIVWAALPLAITFVAGLSRDRVAVFCAAYAAIGTVAGAVLLGGMGVDVNAMFDADIAMSLGIASASHRAAQRTEFWWGAPALATVLTVSLGIGLAADFDPDWLGASYWTNPMGEEAALAGGDIAFLRARSGPAVCEMLALCYWAGKPAIVDVFNLDQQFRTRARDPAALAQRLKARNFRTIQLDELTPFPFQENIREVVIKNYRIARTNDDGVFLVPK